MSDEPSSSAAAAPFREQGRLPLDGDAVQDELLSAATLAERRKKNREQFNRKRLELLDDLVRNLDILIYAELSTIYYMDCHLFRFLIRAIVQFIFLTPKPNVFPAPPKPEPFVGAIFGSNILCILLHVFSSAPSAGEATRGYLHGGVAIDFIGQKGPTSKMLLLLLDLIVTTLQLVHLSAHVARLRLKDVTATTATAVVTTSSAIGSLGQDLESEERGVRRSAELEELNARENIELQTLNSSGRAGAPPPAGGGEEEDEEHGTSERPRETASTTWTDAFLFDAFKNGQIVLADLNPLETVKEQVIRFQKTPPEVRRSTLNAHLASRMIGLRLAAGRR